MRPLLLLTMLLVWNKPVFSQVDSLQTISPLDTVRNDSVPQIRCGPFAGASRTTHFIIAEVMIAGLSAYASAPGGSGSKVMGTIYAATSAGCLIYIPFMWTNKWDRKHNPDFKKDRIWNAVTLLGLSVGYAAVARYNLARSDGHSFGTRFANNFLGVNATVIGSVMAGGLVEKLLYKNNPNSKVQTSLQWYGNGLSLVLAFK